MIYNVGLGFVIMSELNLLVVTLCMLMYVIAAPKLAFLKPSLSTGQVEIMGGWLPAV